MGTKGEKVAVETFLMEFKQEIRCNFARLGSIYPGGILRPACGAVRPINAVGGTILV